MTAARVLTVLGLVWAGSLVVLMAAYATAAMEEAPLPPADGCPPALRLVPEQEGGDQQDQHTT